MTHELPDEYPSAIPQDQVPETLQAYGEGIEEHIRKWFPGKVTRMINHDLSGIGAGSFCFMLCLSREGAPLLNLEIGSEGVIVATLDWYRAVAQATDPSSTFGNHPAGKSEPPEPPCVIRYEDPNMIQQLETAIEEHFDA